MKSHVTEDKLKRFDEIYGYDPRRDEDDEEEGEDGEELHDQMEQLPAHLEDELRDDVKSLISKKSSQSAKSFRSKMSIHSGKLTISEAMRQKKNQLDAISIMSGLSRKTGGG